jgi:trimeric autotransporter adhesin
MRKSTKLDFTASCSTYHAPGILLCAFLFAAGILVFFNISCQRSMDAGLVAYYPFNGNAFDESGNRNNGVVHDVGLTTDRFGNVNSAYHFNGTSSYIEAKVSNMPAVDGAQTISWWYMVEKTPVYSDSLGADDMISLVDTVAGVGVQTGYRAPGYHTLGLDAWYWGGRTVLDSPPPAVKKWHHCVYTYDGHLHRFYVDGKQTTQSTAKPQTGIPHILMFGNYPSGDQFLRGSLDDVRIYDRVLTETEIEKLFKAKE